MCVSTPENGASRTVDPYTRSTLSEPHTLTTASFPKYISAILSYCCTPRATYDNAPIYHPKSNQTTPPPPPLPEKNEIKAVGAPGASHHPRAGAAGGEGPVADAEAHGRVGGDEHRQCDAAVGVAGAAAGAGGDAGKRGRGPGRRGVERSG